MNHYIRASLQGIDGDMGIRRQQQQVDVFVRTGPIANRAKGRFTLGIVGGSTTCQDQKDLTNR